MVKCKECDGEGTIEELNDCGDMQFFVCWKCKGSGDSDKPNKEWPTDHDSKLS
jgi:DnaJ-class molecular chaperone